MVDSSKPRFLIDCAFCNISRVLATGLLVMIGVLGPTSASSYDYPITDAYLSTVVGTAVADEAPVPSKIPTRTRSIVRFPDREISKAFWNQHQLWCSVSAQKKVSPLIFLIAGTGASHRWAMMSYLARLFYRQGFRVISVSSPTHPNFPLAASASGHPGYTPEDSKDLYAVMREAHADLASGWVSMGSISPDIASVAHTPHS